MWKGYWKAGSSASRRQRIGGSVVLAAVLLAGAFAAAAQENKAGGTAERIHVVSDRLVADSQNQTAEFIGNVRAVQGSTEIVSDRLKIFYESTGGQAPSATGPSAEEASIRKLVANGNVVIHMEDKVAETDQAVYVPASGILVLTGTHSRITSEGNSVSGDKITLYRTENRMEVESSGKERVEAVFYPKDKGLNQ
jgi:lipopolysaccharide export system protein LptA